MLLYVVYCVTHALNLLRVFVRNLDVELFLESHHQLNCIKRIGAKIVNEARVGSHFALVYTEFINNYLFYPLLNGPFHFVAPPIRCPTNFGLSSFQMRRINESATT